MVNIQKSFTVLSFIWRKILAIFSLKFFGSDTSAFRTSLSVRESINNIDLVLAHRNLILRSADYTKREQRGLLRSAKTTTSKYEPNPSMQTKFYAYVQGA